MNTQNQLTPVDRLSYEQAYSELEALVITLESGGQSLDDALKLYERGQALAMRCSTLLEEAELKVRQISGEEIVDFNNQ